MGTGSSSSLAHESMIDTLVLVGLGSV